MRNVTKTLVQLLLGVGLASASLSALAAAPSAELAPVLTQVRAYKLGGDTAAIEKMEALVREVDNASVHAQPSVGSRFLRALHMKKASERDLVEQEMIEAIEAGDTTPEARHFIVKQLYPVGGARSAQAFGRLLANDKLAYLGFYGLERMANPEADRVLIKVLATTHGDTRLGVINTLGDRRSQRAAGKLTSLLASADPQVAQAAAKALGKIGGRKAGEALYNARLRAPATLRPVLTEAVLECAKGLAEHGDRSAAAMLYSSLYLPHEPTHVRAAAFLGLVSIAPDRGTRLLRSALMGDDPALRNAAIAHMADIKDPAQLERIAGFLPALDASAQVLLLGALADSGDRDLRINVEQCLLKSEDEQVRIAALKALARLGNGASVEQLITVAAASQGEQQAAAREALDSLNGADADQAMKDLLDTFARQKSKDNEGMRVELIRVLAVREVAPAMPAIMEAAQGEEAPVQEEALKALRVVATPEQLPALLELLVKGKLACDRAQLERTILAVARKADQANRLDPILASCQAATDSETRCSLVRVLGQLGDDRAIATLQTALKDADPKMQEAAVRALADWPTPTPMELLAELSKQAPQETQQILALRGYIRLAGVPAERPEAEKLALYQNALALAKRADEKRQVIGLLATFRSPEAMQIVKSCTTDKELVKDAEEALKKMSEPEAPKQ